MTVKVSEGGVYLLWRVYLCSITDTEDIMEIEVRSQISDCLPICAL